MPPRILIVPNALKGSCSALAAAEAMAAGVARGCPGGVSTRMPMADGGDGMLAVLEQLWQGRHRVERRQLRVSGPLGDPVTVALLWLPEQRTAAVEMAQASGLALLAPAERDPLRTSTRGTGECLRAALDLGARRILIGLGGSATHDGGMGAASALGYRFLDRDGCPLPPIGASLGQVDRIDARDADPRPRETEIILVRDVANPLCGPQGAAVVYAGQKGARPEQIPALDAGLRQLAARYQRDLGADVIDLPGAGAAGGLAAGLVACCQARLEPGAAYLLALAGFPEQLARADLVLTAEGRLDPSSLHGKAPGVIAAQAAAVGVPCIAIAGALPDAISERQALHRAGFTALFSLCPGPLSLAQAQASTERLLADATEQVMRFWSFAAGHARGTRD